MLLHISSLLFFIQTMLGTLPAPAQTESVNWISFEQLAALQKKEPRMVLIHIYTPWCGYCKRMDKEVFTNQTVIRTINKKYYAIKFNAESNVNIVFNGKTYAYNPKYSKRRNGAHELAIKLMNDNTLYPSEIILDTRYNTIQLVRGSSTAEDLIQVLSDI